MLAVIFLNSMISRRRNACKMANEVKTETNTMNLEHCRTCLCTENLVALFNSKESERKRSKDLFTITGLEIKLNDGLSQKMCANCMKSLEAAIKFRRMSRKTYKSLLNIASGVKTKPNITTKEPNIEPPVETAPETKIEELGDDEYHDVFEDDFQNDQDYKVEVEIKPKKMKQKPVKPPVEKKQRVDIPNASSYKCSWCSKEFRMKATFKAHMRFHTNYCVCEACGKRCRNNNQLQEHKRARHGLGKIHKCAYCEYSSATKEALTIHERRHTGERPYICDHCGATFHRRSNLVQHIAIHLPEKNFQCDLCPKRLQSRKLLQIHKHNAHTGKRYGYLCAVCAHRFEKPNKVRAHTRRVHGLPDHRQPPVVRVQLIYKCARSRQQKFMNDPFRFMIRKTKYSVSVCHHPKSHNLQKLSKCFFINYFQCPICQKWQKSHKLLQVHKYKMHRVSRYRYICPVCGVSFTRPGNVRQHLLRGHGVARRDQGAIQKIVVSSTASEDMPGTTSVRLTAS